IVNDACLILDKILVYGSVLRFEGQVGVFNRLDQNSGIKTNYRDLFSEPNQKDNNLSCEANGVLGVLPGIIGTMQAAEVIKIISGVGKPLINKILHFNLLNNGFHEFELSPDSNNNQHYPKDEQAFLNFNYTTHCYHPSKVSDIS
ncbi:MAG: ThiF family adenylyltransferase, partial [Bacteroidota bacterium]